MKFLRTWIGDLDLVRDPPKEGFIDRFGGDAIMELWGATETTGITTISGNEWLDHKGSSITKRRGIMLCILYRLTHTRLQHNSPKEVLKKS